MTEENHETPLVQSIQKQVEYYFSPQNLQNDQYLLSKMNSQCFVPLDVVAGFKMLRNLTTDLELIKTALKSSKKVQMLETKEGCMLRPATTSSARTTIILRDIPKDATEEELRSLFPNKEEIKSIRPDIEDTWFVTFSDENTCNAGFEALHEKKFRGQEEPIKARIKSENFVKNIAPATFPVGHPPMFGMFQPSMPYPQYSMYPPMHIPYPYMMSTGMRQPFGPPMFMDYNATMPSHYFWSPPQPRGPQFNVQFPQQQQQQQNFQRGGGYAGGRGNGRGNYAGPAGRGGFRGRGNYQQGGAAAATGEARNQPAKPGAKRGAGNTASFTVSITVGKPQITPKLCAQDFPPLPSSSQPVGYEKEFKKYSLTQVIEILTPLQNADIPVPEDVPANCPAISTEMNKCLELIRNLPAPVEEAKTTATAAEALSKKTYAEAMIEAKDIKTPEKARRPAGKKSAPAFSQKAHDGVLQDEAIIQAVEKPERGGGRGRGRGSYAKAAKAAEEK